MARDRDYDDDDRPRRRRDEDDDYYDEDDDRPRGSAPPNYLAASILTTVLCCPVFGIVGIVYSAQVNQKWAEGDYAAARSASSTALIWCWLSAGSWVVMVVLAVVASILAEG